MLSNSTFPRPSQAYAFSSTSLVLSALLFSLPANSGEQTKTGTSALPETGLWYDDSKRGAVEITQCGNKLCGHIVWLIKPLAKNGQPIWDKHNPDPSKSKRPICGLQVLGNLARQSDATYDQGWVYDPKVGQTFDVAVNLQSSDVLHVRGYAGLKMFGKSLIWTRAPGDLKRCND